VEIFKLCIPVLPRDRMQPLGAQANSTNIGLIPLEAQHGSPRVASAHVMLAAYGTAAADEAGTYFLAHTFDGRYAPLATLS